MRMREEEGDEPSVIAVIGQIVGAVLVVSVGVALLGPVFADAGTVVGHILELAIGGGVLAYWLTDFFDEPWGHVSRFQPRPHRKRRSPPKGSARRTRRKRH